ncbi:MAG: cation diffusion facilitator family transporter [Christensenellales bacterium]
MTSPVNLKTDQKKRAQISLRATVIGLIANLILAVSKIVAGSLSNSLSVMGDGLNNLSDTGAVLVSFLSLWLAQKPRDKEHPFGHGRMEYMGSLVISVLILYVGIDLMRNSLMAVRHPEAPLFTWTVLFVTAGSIPVKVFLFFFYKRYGKSYHIDTLLAAAQDSRNDALTTIVIVLGLLFSHFYGLLIDGYLGLAVAVLIIWSGINIMRETVNRLIGGKPDKALGNEAIKLLLARPDIKGIHDFVLHDYGPGRAFASVHAEVDAKGDVFGVHEVIDDVEREIMDKLHLPINIHIDPVVEDEMGEDSPGRRIAEYLNSYDPPLSMHDFRLVPGKTLIKLIFDITVPMDSKQKDADIIANVTRFVEELDPRYRCIITIDHDYFDSIAANETQGG